MKILLNRGYSVEVKEDVETEWGGANRDTWEL